MLSYKPGSECAIAIGDSLIIMLGSIYLVALAVLALGGQLNSVSSAAILIGGIGLTCLYVHKSSPHTQIVVLLCAIATVAVSCGLSLLVLDRSYDGNSYHLEAVLALGNGWNPFREEYSLNLALRGQEPILSQNTPWIGSYPMASWIIGAVLTGATTTVETAKAQNLIAAFAAGFTVYGTGRTLNLNRTSAGMIALATAMNPIVIVQATTLYNDGLAGSLLAILIVTFVRLCDTHKFENLCVLFFGGAILLNLKFSMVVIVAVLSAGATLWLLTQSTLQKHKIIAAFASLFFLSVFLFGFAPYVHNLLQHGNIFYPLMGATPIDVLTRATPQFMHDIPTWMRVPVSIFAQTANDTGATTYSLKVPFSFDFEEWRAGGSHDARVGGFGVLFSGIVLISGILAAITFWRSSVTRQVLVPTVAVFVTILASTFIHPGAWWARYVPQLWLAPICICVAASLSLSAAARQIALVVLALMIGNSSLSLLASLYKAAEYQQLLSQEIDGLRRDGSSLTMDINWMTGAWYRVSRAGIPVRVVEMGTVLPCKEPQPLKAFYYKAVYCPTQ